MGGGGGAYILLGVILLCGLLGDEAQNKEASTVWVPGKEPGKGKSGEYWKSKLLGGAGQAIRVQEAEGREEIKQEYGT